MSDSFSCQLVRGMFSGSELESYAWEASWLTWEKNSDGIFLAAEKKLPQNIRLAAYKIKNFFPGTEFKTAWLEKYSKNQFGKEKTNLWKKGEASAILSLSQFRGGRSLIGSFSGYINPGEVLYLQAKEETSCNSKIDKIISGEKIILILK